MYLTTTKVLIGSLLLWIMSCAPMQRETLNIVKKMDHEGNLFGGNAVGGLAVCLTKTDKPNTVEVHLKNEGERPQVVYCAFRVDNGQVDSASDIFLRLTDVKSQEELLQRKTRLNTFALQSIGASHNIQAYQTLQPGEYVSQELSLSPYFYLKEGNKYQLLVEYDHQDSGYEHSGEWIDMKAWTGRAISNRLNFTYTQHKQSKE